MKNTIQKIILLSLLFVLDTGITKAQYQSFFGSQHTTWNMVDRNVWGDYITDSLVYVADTLINTKVYKKVNWYYNYPQGTLSWKSFFREDTASGKLWHLCTNCGTASDTAESLIINMALNVGDSFIYYESNVGPFTMYADSIFYYNSKKHIRMTTQFNPYYKFMFIEGVGTNTYLGYNKGFGVEPILLCQYKDETQSYMYPHTKPLFQGKCSIYISDIDSIEENTTQIDIFPIPTSHNLTINNQLSNNYKAELYDKVGRVIFSKTILNNLCLIDLTNIESGFYTLIIRNNNSNINYSKKISIIN